MIFDPKKIKLIISDVDGVLTDGSIFKGPDGFELKKFSVLDGAAVALLRQAKIPLCLISGRRSEATSERAKELKIKKQDVIARFLRQTLEANYRKIKNVDIKFDVPKLRKDMQSKTSNILSKSFKK